MRQPEIGEQRRGEWAAWVGRGCGAVCIWQRNALLGNFVGGAPCLGGGSCLFPRDNWLLKCIGTGRFVRQAYVGFLSWNIANGVKCL